ncbi:MAG: protein-L-isoaspartate O-methyltransferase [Gammaproteobacteria bacterium]|nr:protein-L-isoaspartate O-methyltransferase [Gammaproteobacteria bacterium]
MNTNTEFARTQMVNQQVRTWDVLDPAILAVFGTVPREQFVPPRYRSLAFADTCIPLPGGQTMLTPQLEGRLLQALSPTASERVLEVGTGSGFMTACLAALGGRVTSLEILPELAGTARAKLAAWRGAEVQNADVFDYVPADRFEVIALTGSLPVHDRRFEDWLAVGGRLFAVCGTAPRMEARLVRRLAEHEWATEILLETVVPPLMNAPRHQAFVF